MSHLQLVIIIQLCRSRHLDQRDRNVFGTLTSRRRWIDCSFKLAEAHECRSKFVDICPSLPEHRKRPKNISKNRSSLCESPK